ncbi:MAG: type I-E CRISPR-associated protein Cse1/CasA [Verrucomicrobia bacterium]|nr:MAG: type I-E CRISPR-associated protein Cse1/CasA [Verrucomicrobiota bacterium]
MNLIADPWIPVLFENGEAKLIGLEQFYRESETIRDLNVNPPQRIALMRLLLCITQAALDGPENEEEWKTCRNRIIPKSLDYLSTRNDKFELYGDQPFLQVKALKAINNAVIDKLDFGLAAGNNATLFDHEAIKEGRGHIDAWKILMLLTYQCFSPGGKIGQTEWSRALSLPKNGTSEHSPCLESSPIHLILRGENVLQTISLNLLTKKQVKELPNSTWGVPIWDAFPEKQNDENAHQTVRSYLGRLIPLSRGILIAKGESQMTLVNGLAYPKLPEGREPMLCVVIKGAGKQQRVGYVNLSLVRHVWRELGSLLCVGTTSNENGALALKNCANISGAVVDFWTGGLVADKGKILDTAEWNFSIPLSMLGEAEMKKYSDGVALANAGEWGLKSAVKSYSKNLKSESGGYSRKAMVHYWSRLDSSYQMLVDIASNGERNLDDWRALLRRAMHDAFEQACPHETPRQIQAFVLAKKLLKIKEKTK